MYHESGRRMQTILTPPYISKREERECQQQKIYDELKKKHSDKKYTDPQLKLWAKLIQSRMHDSYDNPPNIPLIIGINTKRTPNQSTLTGAVVTASNAIASALKPPEAQSQSQQNSTPKSKKNKLQVPQSRVLHAHVPAYVEPFMKI